ncbi:MAG: S41 family peptidase [Erythrobacter sp.]
MIMAPRAARRVIALALVLAPNVAAAQSGSAACDAWAASDAAWPEVAMILRQNYAYLGRVADADAVLAAAGDSAANATSVAQLGTITEALGYAFRDGHFHVSPVTLPERAWLPSSSDLWIAKEGGRWLIADVRRDSAAFAQGVRPGWAVEAMDGQPLAALARAALAPVMEKPDEAQLEYAVNVVVSGKLDETRRFVFRHNDQERIVNLPPADQSIAPRPEGLLSVLRHDSVAHIRFHNSLGDNALIQAFDDALAAVHDAQALIIDLRDTPSGGNTTVARAILGHFVDKPVVYQVHRNAYEESVFGVPRQYAEYVFPRGKRWDRPIVVLAGRWTGSVGEALAMAFDRTAGVPTIGTPLADLLGTYNSNTTENGCMSLSLAWDSLYAADGTPREEWQPRVLLGAGETTIDGTDPALGAALDLMSQADRK